MENLSQSQWDMLTRVVRSNGAGLSAYRENASTWKALYARDLVQGKKGQPYMIVHTVKGLRVWRERQNETC